MHLDLVSIMVYDDDAIDFFTSVPGFEVEDSPSVTNDGRPKGWVVVRPPGGGTGLLLAKADGPEQVSTIGRQFADRVGLFLRVDDFAGTSVPDPGRPASMCSANRGTSPTGM